MALVFVHASKSFPDFGQYYENHLILCNVELHFTKLLLLDQMRLAFRITFCDIAIRAYSGLGFGFKSSPQIWWIWI